MNMFRHVGLFLGNPPLSFAESNDLGDRGHRDLGDPDLGHLDPSDPDLDHPAK